MVEFCEACGKKTMAVIVKNKRGRTNVYCSACGSFKWSADKIDKAHLKALAGGR